MPDDKRSQWDALCEAASLGLMFPVAIGIGFFGGRWLDRLFHTSPWIAITGTALGVAAAFVNLFRTGTKSDGT